MVSLHVNIEAQQAWDALRRAHFPSGRLVVDAHLTLFHALPGEHEAQVLADVDDAARRPPFPLAAGPYRSLGRGVAFAVEAPELAHLHSVLRKRWEPWLTRQDAQGFRPHVTIQNKVDPGTARATLAALTDPPPDAQALGVSVWRYAGGPWEPVRTALFG